MNLNSILSIDIPKEYKPLCNDILRMLSIQITVNILYAISDPDKYKLLDQNFLKTILFIIVGVCVYWMITSKIVNIKGSGTGFYYGVKN